MAAPAWASEVPAALLGKTIVITFDATMEYIAPDGTVRNGVRRVRRTIYVSSKGRIFSRTERQQGRFSEAVESGPEETNFRVEGNRLMGALSFQSGASQLVATFDRDFTGCSAAVVFGRPTGQQFTLRGLDGRMYTSTSSPKARDVTCAVSVGSPFGQ